MQRISGIIGLCLLFFYNAFSQQQAIPKLLLGAAYYDEYAPYERLDKDVQMMKEAGINVVRIAESTWGNEEPQEGVFDFSHVDRVLNAMHKAGIHVIIGTPTYAVPTWLVKKYPDVLETGDHGPNRYGVRQNMDITNPHFLFYAERIIRKLIAHVAKHPAVIGYQVDNETKPYGTSNARVQAMFVTYMKKKFGTTDSMNRAFGLDYWSNRINNWADFPSMNGSVNASQRAEFEKFQRKLVTDFLAWQAKIVREYKTQAQFITQNFDFGWKGGSYGIQPEVDHFAAAKALDIAGCDIYHPAQDALTGIETSFCGDLTRCMKGGKNYLVMETEAQGFAHWVPYPGQLRLQAFSHLASGANMVEYWQWASNTNGPETYWKGIMSQDFQPNEVYNEIKTIGRDFAKISDAVVNLKIENKVAVLFSNEAQTAFNSFKPGGEDYNDMVRRCYDALYRMNVGVDMVDASAPGNLEKYKLLVVPALYAAPDSLLHRLNRYVQSGGHVVYTFKSGYSNQDNRVRSTPQPGIIGEACGIYYNEFTIPRNVTLKGNPFKVSDRDNSVGYWMELITPTTANVLAYYDHPVWGKYAAVTQNKYGAGLATYVGCWVSNEVTQKILEDAVTKAGLWSDAQTLAFPIITKQGTNGQGKTIHYLFNYSAKEKVFSYPFVTGTNLLSGENIEQGSSIKLEPWGCRIVGE